MNQKALITHSISLISAVCMLAAAPTLAYSAQIGPGELTATTTVNRSFDDNIHQVNTEQSEDFITTLGLDLNYAIEKKMQKFDVTASVAHEFFQDYPVNSNTTEGFKTRFTKELGKHDKIAIEDQFRHAEAADSFDTEFGRGQGRYEYYRNFFSTRYDHEISKQQSVSTWYSNSIYRNTRAGSRDTVSHSVGAEYVYHLNSMTSIPIAYTFSYRAFEKNAGLNLDEDQSTTNGFYTGVRHKFTEKLWIDTILGFDILESFSDTTYTKLHLSAALTYEISQTQRLTLSTLKRYQTTDYVTDLFDQWRTSVRYSRDINERLRFSIDGFYGEGDYVGVDREEDLAGVNVLLEYDLTEDLMANLSYRYIEVFSGIDAANYVKHVTSAGLIYEF